MTTWSRRSFAALVVLLVVYLKPASAQAPAARIVGATNAFLTSLEQKQRDSVLFAFDDGTQRARWSNLPSGIYRRSGLKIGALNATQRAAVMAMLSSALSREGYEKVQQIMDADELLKVSGRNNPIFGKDEYYVSILGTPSEKNPWMLQFGGHHLALNLTIGGGRGVLTPSLVGAQPALYTVDGKTIRPMGDESDKAFALLNSLDSEQQKQAILPFRVADLVLGPGQDGKVIQPEGLKASAMNERQRAMLLDLIAEWSGIVHESAAEARMAELRSDLGETWFAWSGPTTVVAGRNGTAYYRIQGPRLVIEYAPQSLGGDPSMHIHSMDRDPTNDYGRKITAR
jgi:hypothetical protein